MTLGYGSSAPQSQPPPYYSRTTSLRVPLAKPLWTYVILAINILAFVATLYFGPSLVLGLGAKNNLARGTAKDR